MPLPPTTGTVVLYSLLPVQRHSSGSSLQQQHCSEITVFRVLSSIENWSTPTTCLFRWQLVVDCIPTFFGLFDSVHHLDTFLLNVVVGFSVTCGAVLALLPVCTEAKVSTPTVWPWMLRNNSLKFNQNSHRGLKFFALRAYSKSQAQTRNFCHKKHPSSIDASIQHQRSTTISISDQTLHATQN